MGCGRGGGDHGLSVHASSVASLRCTPSFALGLVGHGTALADHRHSASVPAGAAGSTAHACGQLWYPACLGHPHDPRALPR